MGVEMKSIALFMSTSLILITLFVENLNWRWTRNLFYSLKGQSSPILALTRSHWITWWSEREEQKGTWEVVKHEERRFYCALWNCFFIGRPVVEKLFLFCGCLTFWNYGEVGWDSKTIWKKNIGKISTPQQPKLSKYNTTVVCITLKMDNLSTRIFQSHGSSHVYSAFK